MELVTDSSSSSLLTRDDPQVIEEISYVLQGGIWTSFVRGIGHSKKYV